MKFSWKEREAAVETLASRSTELLVIGGGVVGCSIAAHAALLGLDCVLLEREDFAAGTSGNSTGLAHAGLRYLSQGRVGYVLKEARERLILERLAPQWVQPFSFVFPVYKGDSFGLWVVRLGTAIYETLYRIASWSAGAHIRKPYQVLNAQEIQTRIPNIRKDGLTGGTEYFVDARLTDSRFTLGFAQKAADLGARVINHISVQSFIEDEERLIGVIVRDEITQKLHRLKARQIINAAGSWIDSLRKSAGLEEPVLQNSKGIHLIVDRIADYPLIFSTSIRSQMFFVLPIGRWLSLIGTTDTLHTESPDRVHVTPDDVSELVQHIFQFFPRLKPASASPEEALRTYQNKHIHEVYWGLRPLLRDGKSTVKASRDYRLLKEDKGLWSVPGVKLTAGRKAGEDVAREAWRSLRGTPPPHRKLVTLPGGEFGDFSSYVQQARSKLSVYSDDELKYLIGRYGTLYSEVLHWADQDPSYRDKVLQDEFWIYAEVAYTVHHEMVVTLNDFLWRRVRWARLRDLPDSTVQRIAEILARYLGWTKSQIKEQIEAYKKEMKAHRLP